MLQILFRILVLLCFVAPTTIRAQTSILSAPSVTGETIEACAKQVAAKILDEIGVDNVELQFERSGYFPYLNWYKFEVVTPGQESREAWVRVSSTSRIPQEGVTCRRVQLAGVYFTLSGNGDALKLCEYYDDIRGPIPCE